MRIYPHLQDSGGFFIAVLQRKPLHGEEKSSEANELISHGIMIEAMSHKRPVSVESDVGDGVHEHSPVAKKARLDGESSLLMPSTIPEASGSNQKTSTLDIDETVDDEATQLEGDGTSEKPSRSGTSGTYKENPFTFISPTEPGVVGCV